MSPAARWLASQVLSSASIALLVACRVSPSAWKRTNGVKSREECGLNGVKCGLNGAEQGSKWAESRLRQEKLAREDLSLEEPIETEPSHTPAQGLPEPPPDQPAERGCSVVPPFATEEGHARLAPGLGLSEVPDLLPRVAEAPLPHRPPETIGVLGSRIEG